jgi:hypothetical protein
MWVTDRVIKVNRQVEEIMTTEAINVQTPQCVYCGKRSIVPVSAEQYEKLTSNKGHIQDIFPDWSPSERELFITGTHSACWDKMFADEDAEDE